MIFLEKKLHQVHVVRAKESLMKRGRIQKEGNKKIMKLKGKESLSY